MLKICPHTRCSALFVHKGTPTYKFQEINAQIERLQKIYIYVTDLAPSFFFFLQTIVDLFMHLYEALLAELVYFYTNAIGLQTMH